ncbi:MAG: energy-coupling factor transporter ATPase [Acutalibacteraceae bacterium]
MSILQVKNLSYKYGVDTPFEKIAVNNVSFSVNKGEIVGIIGHTGSGKSTLVQMLNGLIKPNSGSVLLDGNDIWKQPKKIRQVRFKVGMVFQYPEYQLFEDTVAKDIAYGPANMGLSEEEISYRIKSASQFAGLSSSLLNKSPFDLSGGEKRRVAIAGVIAMEPDILILDEPTAGLDPMGREQLLAQIESYHKRKGNTILLVSHSMEDIARISNRVLVMHNGNLEMLDTPNAVFAQGEKLKEMGLKIPQITQIMNTLYEKGYNVPKGVLTINQAVEYLLPLLKKGECS